MRLTKQTLKRIIKEELDNVLSEMMTAPEIKSSDPNVQISDRAQTAIYSLLNSGKPEDFEQAKSFLDGLKVPPSFIEDYLAYVEEPGAMEKFRDEYDNMYNPDARIEKRPEAYDKLNKIAARHYPDDFDKRFDFSMDMARRAGVAESLKEGILQQMEAEREQRYQDRLDSEDAEERARNARLGQDRIAALNMRSGYGDRGIDMGPDDPGDVDDLYPELREAKLNPTFFQDVMPRETLVDRVLSDPEVDPKIKTMLKRALDNPTEDWAKADIDQVDMLLRTLYPKYAEELDRYDSHQGSLEYYHEFQDFYADPRNRAMKNPDGLMEGLMYEGDDSVLSLFEGATLEEGGNVCGACLFEQLQEASCGCPNLVYEAEYQGRKVTLNKPMRGDVKKFKVYVKDPKTGNIKKVNFGDPNMKIKKSNPKRRKSFRARHNCDNPGPKTKARYWSCKKW